MKKRSNRMMGISCQGHNYWAGDNPTNLIKSFEDIVVDAVKNMDTNLSIKDELSNEMKTQAKNANTPGYNGGSLSWPLNGGTETKTINGGDKVYSGSMPTNGSALVLADGKTELNKIASENSPLLKAPVKFVLGRMDIGARAVRYDYTLRIVA